MTIYKLQRSIVLTVGGRQITDAERIRAVRWALRTEGEGEMGKETIIFFDKMGFGWVMDNAVVKNIRLGVLEDEEIPSRSLIKIIEKILSEKQVL
jgi:ornithine cyclodeaminase/alanine dehydrogenase-like protein (mu-crystallin family)